MKHPSVLDLNLKFFRRKVENAHFLEAKQYLASPKRSVQQPALHHRFNFSEQIKNTKI
jgi:hypothetical protein